MANEVEVGRVDNPSTRLFDWDGILEIQVPVQSGPMPAEKIAVTRA